MKKVRISRDASRELEEAARWYENEALGLGGRLVDAFEHAIDLLQGEIPHFCRWMELPQARGQSELSCAGFHFR